jgi:5-oxopent-3-ene-1,2,5-tricarboxylate decarboxylase / 2-hydroxyhepta-2,4-diene-1,7-dioate isomerase
MKHACVIYQGRPCNAQENDGTLQLANGERVAFDAVTWLPPLQDLPRPRTILALGLNYADHAKELAFKAPDEPLAFVKGQSSLIGHCAHTIRPAGVQMMHYECELAVVMGRAAKKVKRSDAYDFIAGYTVANDYAIRDYLENWYRPNLRVKGRPSCTPVGPWLVDAADVQNPMDLALQTTVNGKLTQTGNTRDMIFDMPGLIEYFSSFMTLQAGDVILTGTPDGVVDCKAGDVVVTSIENIGALQSMIVTLPARPEFVEGFMQQMA